MGGQRKGLSFHPGEKNQEGFLEEVTSKLRSGINQISQSAKGRGWLAALDQEHGEGQDPIPL